MAITPSPKDLLLTKGYQLIKSTPFKSYFHHPNSNVLLTIWSEDSEFIDLETYKTVALNTLKLVGDLRIKYLLTDHRKNNFKWDYEIEHWYSENIIQEFLALGLKKLGVILDDSLFKMAYANSVIEEFLINHQVKSLESRFFDDFDPALLWIHH